MWCHFFESIFHHTVELACFQHQCFFAGICRYTDLSVADIIACYLIFVQDGLDTYDGVQNIWTCVSFKRSETVDIKYIILGSLIGQVTIFDGCQPYDSCSLFCFFRINLMVVHDLAVHLFIDLTDQILQTHDSTVTCLKRLAVFSIHRTESQPG